MSFWEPEPLERFVFNSTGKLETVLQIPKVSQVSQFYWNLSLYVSCIGFPASKKEANGLGYLKGLLGLTSKINKGHFMLIGRVTVYCI